MSKKNKPKEEVGKENALTELTAEELVELWSEIGVPCLPDGTPLGIGDD